LVVHKKRTFDCNVCNKKFSKSCSLKYHTASAHEKNNIEGNSIFTSDPERKTFDCDICNRTFQKFFQLKNHVQYVHKKKTSGLDLLQQVSMLSNFFVINTPQE
jgi:hypothetical protein